MALEARSVPEAGSGFLSCCLVEGDPLQERRSRKLKRRALVVSVLLQLLFLVALLLFPLLGKSERISLAYVTPLPPYSAPRSPTQPIRPHTPSPQDPCIVCRRISDPILTTPGNPRFTGQIAEGDTNGPVIPGLPADHSVPGGLSSTTATAPPPPPPVEPPRKIRVHIGTIEPALLTRRVDPVYPALPKQLGREGRVELHAIIATDGSIQSLEVISGDPLFYQSALAAVREWRYRATILNGQPVEVDTHITVIYSLNRNR
jgi:protein TonB